VAIVSPTPARAATPVSPSDNQIITDTHTPTFTVQLDATIELDGAPRDHDALISVMGSDGHGGTTTLAFCKGIDQGGGRWSCSDPQHPLPNGIYYWTFGYSTHTCLQLPPIGGYQAPPNCQFYFFPTVVGAIFQINVPVAPPPPPPPPPPATDTSAPTLAVFGATGLHGKTLKLHFTVHDDSGKAEIALGIYRAGATIATHYYGLQSLDGTYSTTWTPKQRGSYRFCVIAQDGAGNRSPTRCATVTIR
jgi:hypothetical protein